MAISPDTSKLEHAAAAVRKGADEKLLGQFVNLPSAFKSAGKELLNREQYREKLEGLKQFSVKQLQEAGQALSQLNRYSIKADKRIALMQTIVGTVYPTMLRHYQQYQSTACSLPEGNDRRQAVMACIEIAEQFAMGYKHLYRDLYSAKSAHYRRNRQQIVEAAVRILEMLRLEQRFRALRHQKLPPAAWQDCNRLFFSILAHNDIDAAAPLLGTIGTWSRHGKQKQEIQQCSVRQLYLSLQIFGLVDSPSWSTRLFHAPDGYLELMEQTLQIFSDENQELLPGNLQTGIDHKGPPVFVRDNRMATPRIIIEYSALYNRLMMDYEELAKMKFIGKVDASKLCKPLLSLEPMERLPFLETMLFGLRPRERRQKRHPVFDNENLRLYFGYHDAFRLLMDLADPNLKRVTDTRAFIDTLASHSAAISETGSYQHTKWQIANFSTGGILIVSRETNYTTPIQIGQICAFNPSEGSKRPVIGYVARIHRPTDQQIEVAIVRLSNHAESALVQLDSGKLAGQRLGVILFQNMEGRWCLIARHHYDFVSGTPLRMTRENNNLLPARLGNVMLTRQEFVVFELSAPGM